MIYTDAYGIQIREGDCLFFMYGIPPTRGSIEVVKHRGVFYTMKKGEEIGYRLSVFIKDYPGCTVKARNR